MRPASTLAEGRRELTDLAFLTSVEYRNDLLRYEKKLLDDWLDTRVPGPTIIEQTAA